MRHQFAPAADVFGLWIRGRVHKPDVVHCNDLDIACSPGSLRRCASDRGCVRRPTSLSREVILLAAGLDIQATDRTRTISRSARLTLVVDPVIRCSADVDSGGDMGRPVMLLRSECRVVGRAPRVAAVEERHGGAPRADGSKSCSMDYFSS